MGSAKLWAIAKIDPTGADPVMTGDIDSPWVGVHLYSKTIIAGSCYAPIMNYVIRANCPISHGPPIRHHWSTGKWAPIQGTLIFWWSALLVRPVPLIAHDDTDRAKMNCFYVIEVSTSRYWTKKNINSRQQCPSELEIFGIKYGEQTPIIY